MKKKLLSILLALALFLPMLPAFPVTIATDEAAVHPELRYASASDARIGNIFLDGAPLTGFDPNTKDYKVQLPAGAAFPVVTVEKTEASAIERITQAEGSNSSAIIRLDKPGDKFGGADLYIVTFFRKPTQPAVFRSDANGLAEWFNGNGQSGTNQRSVPHINQEEPRSIFVPFNTEADALANPVYSKMEKSSNFLSLNGEWDFHLASYAFGTNGPPDISGAAFEPGTNWTKIKVPGTWQVNWERAGILGDTPIYTNGTYPWTYFGHAQGNPNAPRTQTGNRTPVGSYFTTFSVPANWAADKHITLSFQGAGQGIYIWVNGNAVGYAEDTFTASEFDITPYIVAGENKLAVRCYRWTQGGFLENQDMINTSGLFRDVFVVAEPKARIRDFAIYTDLKAPYTENVDADFNVTASLNNRYGAAGDYSVSLSLYDAAGTKVFGPISQNISLAAGDEIKEVKFSQLVTNPKKWSAEYPNLYTAVLTLSDGTGGVTESIGRKVGFRKFYMAGAGTDNDPVRMYINGKVIYLKGVNRGENCPFGGLSVPREDMDMEILLMKRNNVNAARTSHYPSDPYMYELYDEFGIYVMDEFNVESHNGRSAGIPDSRDNALTEYPVWRNSFIQRVKNTVLRDRNHPSVILWSTSNEAGFGPNHRRGADWIEVTDPTRLIHNQGVGSDNFDPRYPPTGIAIDNGNLYTGNITQNTSVTAISSIFYPKVVNEIVNYNARTPYTSSAGTDRYGKALAGTPRFPFANEVPRIYCEIEHAMGNSGGGFFVYTDAIEANPHTQGCFIWDWRDQSIYTVGTDGVGFYGYGGDWGTSFGDGDFCGNGVGVCADGSPNPALAEVKADYQEIKMSVDSNAALLAGNINFFNRALFTDPTNAYDFVYTVTTDVKPDEVTGSGTALTSFADPSGMYVVDSGVINLSGKLPPIPEGNALSTPAEIKKVINIPYKLPASFKPGAEYYLNLYFVVKDGTTIWAEKGHVANSQQFKLPLNVPDSGFGPSKAPDLVNVDNATGAITIVGKTADNKDFSVVISKTTGLITEYKADGRVLIEGGPVPSFARAMIPNDMGGQGLGGRASSINTGWRDAGKNKTVTSVEVAEAGNAVTITVKGALASRSGTTNRPSDYSIVYKVLGNGDVEIQNDISPNSLAFGYMSMVGGYLTIPGGYENVTYYGRGPDENYIDRRTGQHVNLYKTKIDDMFVSRLRPQEYGNRTDVRWVALTNDDGYGLMAVSGAVMEFSAKRWDLDQLSTWNSSGTKNGPLHPAKLPRSDKLYLTLIDKQQGVGGEDWSSGPYGPAYNNSQGTGLGGRTNGLPNGTANAASWYPLQHPPGLNFYVQNNRDYSYKYTLRPVFPAADQALAMMESSKQMLLGYEPEPDIPKPIIAWTGNEWDTNTVYAVNREDPHAHFFPYADEAQAKLNHNYYPEKSPYYQTLNGAWKFNHAMRPALRPMENGVDSFETAGYNDTNWDDIEVPSNWQVNWKEDGTLKYDQPIYVNSSTPWARSGMNNGSVPYPTAPKNGFNPVGTYRRTFTLDPAFRGRSVFLTFEGVDSNCYIWVNGYRVGYGEDSYSVKSFDITPWLNYNGTNTIAVQVFRWSAGSWFENQDMMRLSGIFRDIYLTAKPKVALYDVNVLTAPVTPDAYNGNWNLNIKALLRDLGASDAMKNGATLSAKLYDADDAIVGTATFGAPAFTSRQNMLGNSFVGADLSYDMTVATPKLWSAEYPNLYKLVLTLANGAEVLETTCIRVGFRQVKTVNLTSTTGDARLLINGTRLIFWGTNAHESNPETGKVTDIDFIRREYELMKQHNINSVRMAHYPHAPLYYDLADEYGIYIMDEANMENHGLGNPSGTLHQAGLIDRQNNMIARDFNYPSVVVWSTGNECSLAAAINTAIMNFVGSKDSSRPRHAQYADGTTTSTVPELHSGFYGPAQSTSQSASGGWWQNVCNNRRPSVVAEYVHAMGNSNGNLDSFIEIFDKMPKAIGGFIWEWADHGLWTPVPGKPDEKYLAFDGDWDNVRNDGNFCMDGMITADRIPYPQMVEVKYSYRQLTATLKNNGTFTINNKFLFANANEYDMLWELRRNGEVVQSGKGEYNVGPAPAGVVPSVIVPNPPPNVTAPNFQGQTMTSADFPVPFTVPDNIRPGDEYFFNVYFALKEDAIWADKGFVISDSQMPIDFGQRAKISAPYKVGPLEVENGAASVTVSGNDFEIAINKADGVISSYKFMDRDLLTEGPAPNFWRAPIDNEYPRTSTDFGSFGVWRNIGRTRTTTSVTVQEFSLYTIVTASGSFPSTRPGTYITKYTIYPNGEVNVDYTYTFGNITGNNRYLQEVGSMMTVKSGFENLTWFGRGPGESYTDRKWGNFVGLWDGTVSGQEFPYAMTQEMGNKVEARWLALTDDDGFGMIVKGGQPIEFNALHYTPETLGARRYQHPYQISPMEDICLRVNLTSVGVGGNDSWGRIPEDKYRPMAGNNTFRYNYSILPVEEFDAAEAIAYGKTDYISVFTVLDGGAYIPVKGLSEAEGKTLRATVEIDGDSTTSKSVTAYLAIYSASGKLLGITPSAPTPISAGEYKAISIEVACEGITEGMSARLFVWDSETYIPLGAYYELK